MRAERITGSVAYHGESPVWSPSSPESLAPDDEPMARSLFRVDVGVCGQAVRVFNG